MARELSDRYKLTPTDLQYGVVNRHAISDVGSCSTCSVIVPRGDSNELSALDVPSDGSISRRGVIVVYSR